MRRFGLLFTIALFVASCSGGSQQSVVPNAGAASSGKTKVHTASTACYAAWNSSTAYNGGAQVSYNGVNYTAAYWTQGQNPSTNNGPAGSGEPWISDGPCGGPTATPSPNHSPSPTPKPTATPTSGPPPSGFIFSQYKDVS